MLCSLFLLACAAKQDEKACCPQEGSADNPREGMVDLATTTTTQRGEIDKEQMVLIPEGTYTMGAVDDKGRPDEYPPHVVSVSAFYMAAHEVTNADFRAFVQATGYQTVAERDVDWEVMKNQVAPGTPKPHDSLLLAGSLVFSPPNHEVDLSDFTQWWSWKTGADWQHPQGPGSNIEGKDDHPVTQVCWFDAVAYCEWVGGRLPTEAEWEWAARAGRQDAIYSWGNEFVEDGEAKANSWQGGFPYDNLATDGFSTTAPVGSFEPNPWGLYDMSGNVWEWCSDYYRADEYARHHNDTLFDPKGPKQSYDPRDPYDKKRVQRGGSFLCNEEYCASYRISARMPGAPDTGMPHLGFRVVMDVE